MKKKMISLLLVLALVVGICPAAFAVETAQGDSTMPEAPAVYMNAMDKVQFAAEKDRMAKQIGLAELSLAGNDQQEISDLILRAAVATGDELETIDQDLETLGVYRYPAEEIGAIAPLSDSSSVIVNAPRIYYTPAEQSWTVATGGKWRTSGWLNEKSLGSFYIGGPDGFGVGYSSTSGTFNSAVQYCTGILTNGDDENYKSALTSNRSDGDGRVGFGFQLQDYYYTIGKLGTLYGYVGTTWAGYCAYDENFANYDGIATSYYVHTWDKGVLNSVNFQVGGSSAGGSGSIGFSITNAEKSFKAYSNDTRF